MNNGRERSTFTAAHGRAGSGERAAAASPREPAPATGRGADGGASTRASRHVGLDALRGLAMLCIVLYHLASFAGELSPGPVQAILALGLSSAGLFTFFGLSALVLAERAADPPARFWGDRCRRIYPGFWAALAIASLVVRGMHGGWPRTSPLLALLVPTGRAEPIPIPYWTLVFELALYAFVFLVGRVAPRRVAAALAVWTMLTLVLYDRPISSDAAFPSTLFAWLFSPYAMFFAPGALAARGLRAGERPWWWAAIAVVLFAAPHQLAYHGLGAWLGPLGAHDPSFLLGIPAVFCAVRAGLLLPAESRVVRALAWLGGVSYGVYLLHMTASVLAVALLRRAGWSAPFAVTYAALGLLVLVPSIAFGALDRALQERLKRRRGAVAERPASEAPVRAAGGRPTMPALTSIRFFAAASIVLYHAQAPFGYALPAANYSVGVTFFFVLSGFLLAYSHADLDGFDKARDYYVARFARVWPLHAATLVWVACAFDGGPTHRGPVAFAANALLVQAWWPSLASAFSYNAVAWSVSDEAFFYLLLPAVVVWRRHFAVLFAAWLVLVAAILAVGSKLADPTPGLHALSWQTFVHTAPPVRFLEFLAGVGLGLRFVRSPRPRLGLATWTALETVAIAATLAAASSWSWTTLPLDLGLGVLGAQWALYSGILPVAVFAIACFAHGGGLWSRVLEVRVLVVLGEISYATYLIHQILLRHALAGGWVTLGAWSPGKLALFLAATYGLSWLAWRFYERPARAAIVAIARARFAAPDSSPAPRAELAPSAAAAGK